MIILQFLKKTSLAIEYASFLLCFFYWLFYSIVRVKGIPVFFSGVQVNSVISGIVVLVILLFNAIFFVRLFLEIAANTESLRARLTSKLLRHILPLSLSLVFIGFVTGGRFDYASYKLQWHLMIGGGDPWGFVEGGMVNAYGYVFNFLAVLYSVDSLVPKLFFVLLLVLFCWQLIVSQPTKSRTLVLFLCINPFTISTIAVYGFIDGMCSLLLGFALLEQSFKPIRASMRAGVFLALSTLTKFYSIVALPILLFANWRSNTIKDFVKGYLFTFIVILTFSYVLWGDSILTPLLFAKGRDPSFLTLWKYVSHPELRTIIFSITSAIAIALACVRSDLSCSYRTAATLSIIFGTYYLGHQQFYLGILVALTVYIVEVSKDSISIIRTPILWSFALMLGWLIFIQTGFELYDEFKPIGFQNLLPFLSFLNSTILVASGFFWLSSKPTRAQKTTLKS